MLPLHLAAGGTIVPEFVVVRRGQPFNANEVLEDRVGVWSCEANVSAWASETVRFDRSNARTANRVGRRVLRSATSWFSGSCLRYPRSANGHSSSLAVSIRTAC